VWIDDYFLRQRVIDGLDRFDLLGVAGNRRRLPGQSVWSCIDSSFTEDEPANLSGMVAHGQHPFGALRYFGEVPARPQTRHLANLPHASERRGLRRRAMEKKLSGLLR